LLGIAPGDLLLRGQNEQTTLALAARFPGAGCAAHVFHRLSPRFSATDWITQVAVLRIFELGRTVRSAKDCLSPRSGLTTVNRSLHRVGLRGAGRLTDVSQVARARDLWTLQRSARVHRIAYAAGYERPQTFFEHCQRLLGMSPSRVLDMEIEPLAD